MGRRVLVAGAGIGGLAAALACTRAGWGVQVIERAVALGEVGAGIQLGPNVTRLLHGWGLANALASVATFPSQLQVRSAQSGRVLGVLRLGDTAQQRYGAPYATLRRADLHCLLHAALSAHTVVDLQAGCALTGFAATDLQVCARLQDGRTLDVDVLVGADGLWSVVRQGLLHDGPPRVTGHVAYRAMVRQGDLPQTLRSQHISVWLGPDLHVVVYPVCAGEWLNVVGIVQAAAMPGRTGRATGDAAGDPSDWNQETAAAGLRLALNRAATPLQDLVRAIHDWRCWVLCDRALVSGADQLVRGRVALLGDAAHPMRPYLAQGAGMAIEDAAALGHVLEHASPDDPQPTLQHYATQRWQRAQRVQKRALRNGQIFHARGLVRWGRDLALRALGERVLDLPWLYRY